MKCLIVPAIMLLAGCVPPADTPSGATGVTIKATTKQVKDFIMSEFAGAGWRVVRSDDYTFIIGIPENGVMASLVAGTRMNATPEMQAWLEYAKVKIERAR